MKTLLLAILVSVAALSGIAAGGDAREGSEVRASVRAIESGHRIEFPERIVISLSADAQPDVQSVRLFYTLGGADARIYARPKSFDNTARLAAEFVIRTGQGSFIPQGVDLEYYYVFTDSQGIETESDRFTFEYLDPSQDWRRLEYQDFTIIYHDRSQRAVRSIASRASIRMARVKALLDLDGDYDFKAVIINDRREATQSFPPVSQTSQDVSLYGGFAFGAYGALTLAGLDQDGLVHELTHLMVSEAMGATGASPRRIPGWLNEGIAMYFEPNGGRRESEVRRAYRRGDLIPIRQMRAVPGRPEDVHLFYSQSDSIVRFMGATFGEDRLSKLFAELAAGESIESALDSTYGLTVEELDAAWRLHLSGRGSLFEEIDPATLGTSAVIGGAILASATIATVRWIKRLQDSE